MQYVSDTVQVYNLANTLARLGLVSASRYVEVVRRIANSGGKYATVNDRGYIVSVGIKHSARPWR